MKNSKQKIAKKIVDISTRTAIRTTGKSFPSGICEVKLPDEVKAYLKEQK